MESAEARAFEPRRLAAALAGSVDVAFDAALDDLQEEILLRATPGADQAQVARTCGRLRDGLQRQSAQNARKFEQLTLRYLLRAPEGPIGDPVSVPAGLAPHRDAALDAAEPSLHNWSNCSNIVVGGAGRPSGNFELDQEYDEQLSDTSADLAAAVRKARSLQADARQLTRQLQLLKSIHASAYDDASTGGGVKQVACDLQEVVAKLGKFLAPKEAQGNCLSPSKRSRTCEDVSARSARAIASHRIN